MAKERDRNPSSADDTGGGLFTVVSVAVLVGTEIIGAALAGGWALGGMAENSLGTGPIGTYALMGLFCAGGLALLAMFVRSALRIEGTRRRA